jgi:hypothetical protein
MALALCGDKICHNLVEGNVADQPLKPGEGINDLEWDAPNRLSRAPWLSQRKNIALNAVKGCRVVLSGAKKDVPG